MEEKSRVHEKKSRCGWGDKDQDRGGEESCWLFEAVMMEGVQAKAITRGPAKNEKDPTSCMSCPDFHSFYPFIPTTISKTMYTYL